MNIKSTLSIFSIVLFFNVLLFAQTENQYSKFDPASMKENAKYARNFAPNNYDETILYQCFSDMVDIARAEYRYLPKLKHDIRLDSTAQYQADYQASKDEKTLDNNAPYKTTYFRLRKYGLAGNGDEFNAYCCGFIEKKKGATDFCVQFDPKQKEIINIIDNNGFLTSYQFDRKEKGDKLKLIKRVSLFEAN